MDSLHHIRGKRKSLPGRSTPLPFSSVREQVLGVGVGVGVGPVAVDGLDVLVGVAPAADLARVDSAITAVAVILFGRLGPTGRARFGDAADLREPVDDDPLVHVRRADLLPEEHALVLAGLEAAECGLVHLVALVDDDALCLLDADEVRLREVARRERVHHLGQLVAEGVPLDAELAHERRPPLGPAPFPATAAEPRLPHLPRVPLQDLPQHLVVDALHAPLA
mmetsp:Transcript_11495/g.29678  ORF Transcript_11495/g.29678 Transcript_11495/m.29678 type:complete len:223 (-) Transcript_11495:305-973(-)